MSCITRSRSFLFVHETAPRLIPHTDCWSLLASRRCFPPEVSLPNRCLTYNPLHVPHLVSAQTSAPLEPPGFLLLQAGEQRYGNTSRQSNYNPNRNLWSPRPARGPLRPIPSRTIDIDKDRVSQSRIRAALSLASILDAISGHFDERRAHGQCDLAECKVDPTQRQLHRP